MEINPEEMKTWAKRESKLATFIITQNKMAFTIKSKLNTIWIITCIFNVYIMHKKIQ
jgi:hypothetical protein